MPITISGWTNQRSATTTARGSIITYWRNEATTGTTSLINSSLGAWSTGDNWVQTYVPVATNSNSSFWNLGPAGNYPFELSGRVGRYVLAYTSAADTTSPLGFDNFTITSQNYYLNYSFEQGVSLSNVSSDGTLITCGNTNALTPGRWVTVSAGTGAFVANTYIVGILSTTQFRVSAAPSVALSGASVSATGINTVSGASSSGTTVTVASTAGLLPNAFVTVTSGTGAFAANTFISSIVDATTFTVNTTPTTPLSGATVTVNNQALGWRTSVTSGDFNLSNSQPLTTTATTLRWYFSNAANASNGPSAAQSGSFYLQNTATSSSQIILFSPALPMSPSPWQANYQRDLVLNTFYLGRSETAVNASATIAAPNMPTWVTSPTYSIPTMTGGSSSGTTVNVSSIPQGLQPGAYVTVSAGTGTFAAGTYITAINSGTQFVVSQTPTVALSGATIVLANTSSNGGLPPGLSINASTGEITGTLDVSGLSSGLTDYRFCIRCDFTFSSASHSFTGIDLAGSNTANFEYEVVKTDASLQSATPDLGELGDELVVAVTMGSPTRNTITDVQEIATPEQFNATLVPPTLDPRRTPVIIIG